MNIRTVLHRLRTLLSFLWAAIPSLVLALGASPAFGQPSVEGQWVQPKGGDDWPLKTKDAIQLPTGKVLVWENLGSSAKLYDPTNGKFSDVPLPVPPFTNNVHCPGHAFLSDGTLLVAGGGQDPRGALDETRIFDPDTEQWQEAANLNLARWYPTCTTLPDGRVLAVVGKDASGLRVVRPEIYHPATSSDPDAWVLMGPQADVPWFTPTYPFMFVLPDGKVFYAGGGSGSSTFRLDIDSETWEPYPGNNSIFGGRKGAAVMYEPGKILKCGGQIFNNAPIEQRTAMIDLTDPTPTWDSQAQWDLPEERKDHNLVLLPDGKILLVGGENDDGFIHSALMWDPQLPELQWGWQDMADMTKDRGHHATAVLLPDTRVLSAGGNDFNNPDHKTAEIYEPPYLFAGPPPVIGPAPSSVQYGCQFLVTATPIGDIQRVTLVRPATVTHWFDSDQRFLELTFTVVSDELLVDAPANANLAPPGYCMLFVLDDGVPSVAEWIQFPNDCPADLDNDDDVGAADLAILLGAWGPNPGHPADLSCDGVVEAFDLALLLGAWGPCPNSSQGSSHHGGTELINALVEMGYANVAEHTAWSTAAPTEDALASGQQLLELLGE